MATLTPTPTGHLIEQLSALKVRVGVFVMPAGTVVAECRYRDHDTLTPIPAVVDLYTDNDEHLGDLCLDCAIHIATEQGVRAVDVKRIDNPTVELVADDPTPAPLKVSMIDRDGRFATVERVGVEVEVAVLGRPTLAFDLATPAGVAAARVFRDQLTAALNDAA